MLDGFDLGPGDFLLDLSVCVSSKALIGYCRERGVPYLNTAVNPWSGDGDFYDPKTSIGERINYRYLEELITAFPRNEPGTPTALVGFGINPGLVSMWLKRALRMLARERGIPAAPKNRKDWARLARDLGVQVVQISEYDGQRRNTQRQKGVFGNTWSVTGFVDELVQGAELGWGSHEVSTPSDMRFYDPQKSVAYLTRMGGETLVRSWAPNAGPFLGFCIPHQESVTISDYLEIDGYRPTAYYAYRPCDEAVLSIADLRGTGWKLPIEKRDMSAEELTAGVDEIGVFLMGYWDGEPFAFWSGSHLDAQTAKTRAKKNTATTLQVNAAILAAFLWTQENPNRGLVFPEDLDDDFVLSVTDPYTEPHVHKASAWNPTLTKSPLFPSNLNRESVFQFTNFRAD